MTSIIKLEAISGAMDDGPSCYLLQVDQFHFLLDCGWDSRFDMAYMDVLRKKVPLVDAVLLTHADISHAGALPYLVGKCGLACPVYATVPVYKMGQMFLYDWYLNHHNVEEFDVFSLDDVDQAFELVQQVKFNQQVSLKGKGHGLQITACIAGHMVGGALWRITKMGEEEIVYAVDFNHKKERHLNGCSFENIVRPSLLITDARLSNHTQARRKQRDELLLTNILSTLRNRQGDVLVTIDTAGRVLEIAHLLDQLWASSDDAGLHVYPLVVMSNVASNVVEFAKSQVEWMSEKVLRLFEDMRANPFHFKHVRVCHSLTELRRVTHVGGVRTPAVVLASQTDMECGFSRQLFLEWSADPRNTIILTQRAQQRSLAAKLIRMAETPEAPRMLTLEIKRRIRLEGAELESFWIAKRSEEREAARIKLDVARRSRHVDTLDDSDSDEADAEQDTVATAAANLYPYDVMYKLEMQHKSSFFKQNRRIHPMYPFAEEKTKFDEYGEVIRPSDYTIAESLVPSTSAPSMDETTNAFLAELEASAETANDELPSKCITSVTKLEALCKLVFIEFEGVSDGESIRRLLAQIKPKQLILVRGGKEATNALADHCRSAGIGGDRVFTPSVGDVVDATIESHIYQVTLSDALMCSLQFQRVKDAELAWLDARIVHKTQDGDDERMDDDGQAVDKISLDLLAATNIPAHTAVFVNDPRLSDLKQLLTVNGYKAEFAMGVLYVNNNVAIHKTDTGRFHLEGTMSDDYYNIRDVVYRQFAIV